MSNLLVVTGPPGAGKSTVAALVAERASAACSSRATPSSASSRVVRSTRGCGSRTRRTRSSPVRPARRPARFALGGFDTVYDGVVGPWFLPAFAAADRSRASSTTWCCSRRRDVPAPGRHAARHTGSATSRRRARCTPSSPRRRSIRDTCPRRPPPTPAAVADAVVARWRAGIVLAAGRGLKPAVTAIATIQVRWRCRREVQDEGRRGPTTRCRRDGAGMKVSAGPTTGAGVTVQA